jgi:hypothetical protein
MYTAAELAAAVDVALKTAGRRELHEARERAKSEKAADPADVQAQRTAALKDHFLKQYEVAGTISGAARAAQINRSTHYDWFRDDPEYVERFTASGVVAVENLETEMRRRAIVGWDEPVFQGGKQVGVIKKRSDVLLIFALKAARPHVYRDHYIVRGDDGKPLPLEIRLTDDRDDDK